MNCQHSTSTLAVLFALVLAAPFVASGQQLDSGSGGTLTIEQAVSIALENNRQVKIKALSVGKAEDQLAAARTSRLPKFNAYTLASQQLVNEPTQAVPAGWAMHRPFVRTWQDDAPE